MFRSRVELLPHDPSWRDWFAQEAERITSVLGDVVLRIEHVGSTAVPELLAKPIIDIAIIVANPDDFERCVQPLIGLGYIYRGQNGDDSLRRYFVLEMDDRRVAQLHLWAGESPSWRQAVAFRDLLRTRADIRSAYTREKLHVAEAVGWSKGEYSVRKGPFIKAIIETELPTLVEARSGPGRIVTAREGSMESGVALERVNYFSGQMLVTADFRVEQDYFLAKLRRHNRYLHGWGVVSGLGVSAAEGGEVIVDAGIAIDCAGNEIFVCERTRVAICPDTRTCFVILEYLETPTAPAPASTDPAVLATGATSFTRIREGFRLESVVDNPSSGHRGRGPGTPGCGGAHAVCIARIRRKRHRWTVEPRGRRGE